MKRAVLPCLRSPLRHTGHADTANQTETAALVRKLRNFVDESSATVRASVDPLEECGQTVYRQLRELNYDAILALSEALSDPDVRVRRNTALALAVLGGLASIMNLAQFHIGLEFWCDGKRWRCTDVGSRVVVAISLEPHEVVSLITDPQDRSHRTERRHVTDDPSRLSGPPYGVVEHVFDENDIQGCSLAPDDE